MIEYKNLHGTPNDLAVSKRFYATPALQVFGKVAALTRSASGACTGDNVACGAPGMTKM